MIKIEFTVSHPGATPADEERLREVLARNLPHCITAEAVAVEMDCGRFFNSLKLEVNGAAVKVESALVEDPMKIKINELISTWAAMQGIPDASIDRSGLGSLTTSLGELLDEFFGFR